MPKRYDVVVIGSGPAGASAASFAAAHGLSTLLVDRKGFPRGKACGDGLTPRAVRALESRGLGRVLARYPRIVGVKARCGQASRELRFGEHGSTHHGAVVPRRILDEHLRQHAVDAGARFIGDTSVAGLRADRQGRVTGVYLGRSAQELVRARHVIVADGSAGSISRSIRGRDGRFNRSTGVAARQYLGNVRELNAFFEVWQPLLWQGRSRSGYGWAFPGCDGAVNVGVGLLEWDRDVRQGSIADLMAWFIDFLRTTDARFVDAVPLEPAERAPLTMNMADPDRAPLGATLAGDAAGLINPFTGEGIANALESGELAARSAVLSIRNDRPTRTWYKRQLVARYHRQWTMRDAPRHARWILALGFNPGASSDRRHSETADPALQALANAVLDETPRRETRPPAATSNRNVGWLLAATRRDLFRRLKLTDRVLALIGDSLMEASPAGFTAPLLVAGSLVGRDTLEDRTFRDAMLGLSAFGLSASVVAHLPEFRQPDARTPSNAESAAITIADCLATEAATALARLPGKLYTLATASLALASHGERMSYQGAKGTRRGARYRARARPIESAALIATCFERTRIPVQRIRREALWVGEAALMLDDLRKTALARADVPLRQLITRGTKLEMQGSPPLREAIGVLLVRCHEALVHPAGSRSTEAL